MNFSINGKKMSGYLVSLFVFNFSVIFMLIQATIFNFVGVGVLTLYILFSSILFTYLGLVLNSIWLILTVLNLMAIGTFMPANLLLFGSGDNAGALIAYILIYKTIFFLAYFVAYNSPVSTSNSCSGSSSDSSSDSSTRRRYYGGQRYYRWFFLSLNVFDSITSRFSAR